MPTLFTPPEPAMRILTTVARVLPATGRQGRSGAEIDRAAARLWGLSDEELADIQAGLQELKG